MKTLHLIASTLLLSILFYSCDKNEFAPEVADQDFAVAENSPAGTVIGAVEASDADEGQVVSYEIIDGNENGEFNLNSSNGILTVGNAATLDFESAAKFALEISVSDGHKKDPLESTATVEIQLTDVNEFAPEMEAQAFEVDENPESGQEIGNVVASDEETHQKLIYTVVGGNEDGAFEIDSQTGSLKVADPSAFDYETNPQRLVMVEVKDDHANSMNDTETISIKINNLLEISDGQIAYFPFDGNTEDAHGEFDGTGYNVQFSDDDQQAENKYLLLSGDQSYVNLNSPFDLETITINLSFNVSSAREDFGIIYTSDNPDLQYGFSILSVRKSMDGTATDLFINFSNEITSLEIVENQWYNVTMVREGQSYSYYLDGELIDSGSIPSYTRSYNGSTSAIVGSLRTMDTRYFHGMIDDLRIYEVALTQEEIESLFTNAE